MNILVSIKKFITNKNTVTILGVIIIIAILYFGYNYQVEKILKKYDKFPTAMQGLGYKEVVEYLDKKITKEEMIEKIKMETRRYAKRQITWFKKIENVKWIQGNEAISNNINLILK